MITTSFTKKVNFSIYFFFFVIVDVIIQNQPVSFVKNLAPASIGGKWGYINRKGDFVIRATYADAEVFSLDGLAPVKVDDWGFINEEGKIVIQPRYIITAGGIVSMFLHNAKGFVNGLARVKNEGHWGFIKPDGSVLGNQWYQNAELFQK